MLGSEGVYSIARAHAITVATIIATDRDAALVPNAQPQEPAARLPTQLLEGRHV